jgi:molecular chaperone GrpE
MTRKGDSRDIPIDDEGLAPQDADAAEDQQAIATELGEELAEVERVRDRLLRLQAEFDNFRKREARERAAAWARAKADLVQKLLVSLDDLDRVAHLDARTATAESVVDGVALVERKILESLEREGLVGVGEVGEPFDPHVHEAIGTVPSRSPDDAGKVAAVHVRGYRFGNQLLRPAQVQVYDSSH